MWCATRFVKSLAYSILGDLRNVRTGSCSAASYLHNPGTEPLRYATVAQALQAAADRWPDRAAVRSLYQDVTISYSQLIEQADALGCGLRGAGLERGDRLGIWAHNSAEWIVSLAAAARVGLIPVAINPAYEKTELSFCINKVGMKGIVVADKIKVRDYFGMLSELTPELRTCKPGLLESSECPNLKTVVTLSMDCLPGTFIYHDLIKENKANAKNDASKYSSQIEPEDGFIIHFTSGTTGTPKAALVSHFSAVNNSYLMGKRITLDHGHETICVQVPLFHAFGTVITVMSAWQHGATLVLPSALYSPSANARALLTERCTVVHGTPTMYVDAVNTVRTRREGSPPCLRVALTAGAPCGPQLFSDIQQHLHVDSVKSIFGMTETTAAVFQSLPGETMDKVTDTVGYLHDHVQVKVVDEQGRVVPFGTAGELLVRGYNVMMGYWGEEEKTRQTVGADGWLRTGDQFTIAEHGYGSVVGRIKDLIIRGGENIHPKEIEDILNMHPDVVESQVFGVVDPRLGEEVCAVLRVRDGAALTPGEVARHCRGKLAQYKLPRLVKTIEHFPKTGSGKVQKYKLREMVESGKL